MADQQIATAVVSLAHHMNAMTARLEEYNGSDTENVGDFILDFVHYCVHLGQTTSDNQKVILASKLKNEAKKWYRLQPLTADITNLLQGLQEHFQPTPQALLSRKVALYATKQQTDQTFMQYVSVLRESARPLDISEAELVNVCLAGCSSAIRPHLTMAKPQTFQQLLALPLARDPSITHQKDESYVAMAEIQDIRSTVTKREPLPEEPHTHTHTRRRRGTPGTCLLPLRLHVLQEITRADAIQRRTCI